MPMSSLPKPSNSSTGRTATKSTSQTFSSKAARKLMPMQTESDSSDGRSTTGGSQNDDSDSDGQPRRSNHDVRRHPPQARPTLASRKRVKFDANIRVDSDSDDATVRGEPSQPRVQQNLPAQSELSRSPPIVNQMKPSGKSKAQKSRGSALNQSDIADDKPRKTTGGNYFRRVKDRKWGSKYARKEHNGSRRQYARMSIGSANQRGSSHRSNIPQQDKRRRWFVRRGNIGSRGRRRTSNREDGSERYESDEDIHQTPRQTAPKSVRKSQSAVVTSASLASRPLSDESDVVGQQDIYDPFQHSDAAVDEPANEYLTDSSETDGEEVLEHTEPSQTLLDKLEQLSSSVVRLQKMRRLPFLRRNLRKGFQLHCRVVGVDTKPHPLPRTSVSVVYSCPPADGASSHSEGSRTTTAKSSMKDWLCPLCDLHKKFDNSKMLDKHLAWDHPSVRMHWDQHYTTLSLTIPDSQPEINPVITRPVLIRELSTSEPSADVRHVEKNKSVDPDEKPLSCISSTPSGVASEFGSSSVSTPFTEEDLKPKYDTSGYSNHGGTDTWSRSSSVSGRSASQVLSGADAREGLGPSAVPPYLPETDERGDVYYSCRIGGPRLFDFLNTLSLKPYGVLKWVIIDREEELFELDDILDEDKVIQALWFRWIFLHRNRFVANYFDGTKAFIKDNWELIKQGAGLLALRTWLLVLLVNNFLLPTEVATLMRYYQELADIQLDSK